jgi:PAS domain S-box-containing protein
MLPVTLASILFSVGTAYYIARVQIVTDAQEEVRAKAKSASFEVHNFLRQMENDLATISDSTLFRDFYMNEEYGLDYEAEVYRKDIRRMLSDFSNRTGIYPQITYVDSSGREIVRVRNGKEAAARFSGPIAASFGRLKKLPKGAYFFERLEKPGRQEAPIIRMGRLLLDAGGGVRGALFFDCNMTHIYSLIRRLQAGSPVGSYLTDAAGAGKNAGVAQMRQSLTASSVVKGTPWAVVSVVDESKLLEGLEILGGAAIFLCLFVCVVMTLVIVRLVRAANKPIERLVEAVRSYAEGDLEARVDIREPREAAALASAFNDMAERLYSRTEDLVRRVRELAALKRMSDAVLNLLGRREIGKACLESAVSGLSFERGILYWVDEKAGVITGECGFGMDDLEFSDEAIRRRRVPLDSECLLAEVVRDRKTINVGDETPKNLLEGELFAAAGSRYFCLAPVSGRGKVLGVIGVDVISSGKPVCEKMVRSLTLFCGAAGLALENATLLDDIVQSEDRFRAAVENHPDGIAEMTSDFKILHWNRRAEAVFGHRKEKAVGATLALVIEAVDYRKMIEAVCSGLSELQFEAAGRAHDGRRLDLRVTWVNQGSEDGRVRGWMVTIHDMTEQNRLQANLMEMEKTSAAGNLIAGVAHELNNPLAGVVGFAELLQGLPADPEEREDLRQLCVSALRCRDIVQGLLTFVAKDRGKITRVKINSVVEATIALLEYRMIKSEQIRLEVQLDPSGPEVAAEFNKLQQVFVNLFNNAIDALRGRSGPRVIRVRTRLKGERVTVEVEDTGPGVPEQERRKIFEPFVTSKDVGKGTGLGLSISAQIIEKYGGILRCDEGPEGGARFTAWLSKCPDDVPETKQRTFLPPAVPGRRVLIVDDEPELARMMSRLLNEDGVKTEVAANHLDATRKLRGSNFDLVITDVELGTSLGTELFAFCENFNRRPGFLFVTGDVLNQALSAELARLGAPVLYKPFLRTEFLRAVRRELERGALADQ